MESLADSLSCLCGKTFAQQNALSNHKRTCQRSKREISALLSKAKAAWAEKRDEKLAAKKRKISPPGDARVLGSQTFRSQFVQVTSEGSQPELELEASGDIGLGDVQVGPSAPQSDAPLRTGKDQLTPANESRKERVQRAEANCESDVHMTSDLPQPVRRSQRETRVSQRLQDMIPVSEAIRMVETAWAQKERDRRAAEREALLAHEESTASSSASNKTLEVSGRLNHPTTSQSVRSIKNAFHVYHQYDGTELPSHDPDSFITLEDLSDIQCRKNAGALAHERPIDLGPYPNRSSFLIGEWYWRAGLQKSKRDFRSLLEILTASDFDLDDLRGTQWESINKSLGATAEESDPSEDWVRALKDAGWFLEEVSIEVPFPSRASASRSKEYSVGEFYRRSIVSVIRERIGSIESRHLHFVPHEVYWQPEGEPPLRVYGELYHSPAFIEAHREIQHLPREGDCQLRRVVIALMFASDETHLTQFGETKLWPLYMFLGNDSKYRRLPDTFKEFVQAENGEKGPSPALLAHCAREVLHAQWRSMLDCDFMEAYEHGIVEKCGHNGESYRFYPRIFTYSADYKEKVVLCSIRNLGTRPCPRCLVPKKDIHNLSLESDKEWRTQHIRVDDDSYRQKITDARTAIYDHNYVVNSKTAVDPLLKEQSLVPVETAFTTKLASSGFNFFEMSVVDLMHEIESGNWKSLFIQILRILDVIGDHLTIELDSRYRQIPTFGSDSIRRFRKNVSQMKNLAARDWEDMLQCALPVFEGLLPEPHNSILLDLLFSLAYWHGFAKLRIHTDATLERMDTLTSNLGQCYRTFFYATCSAFATRELGKEATARARRNQDHIPTYIAPTPMNSQPDQSQASSTIIRTSQLQEDVPIVSGAASHRSSEGSNPSMHPQATTGQHSNQAVPFKLSEGVTGGRRPKTLNMNTYKFHAMGDYTTTIRRYGTTDSYSTEASELEHRTPKNRYSRTNKKDFIKQLVQIERRQARIRTIRRQINEPAPEEQSSAPLRVQAASTRPADRYLVGKTQNDPIFIPQFLQSNFNDPAIKGFFVKLKSHLASRAANFAQDALDETQAAPKVFIQQDTLFRHKTIRLNYTTYDVRRAQDVINPSKSLHNIMVLSTTILTEEGVIHPFMYGRVLGIFHVNVIPSTPSADPKRIDFLWVRWYDYHKATSTLRLDRLSFPPLDGQGAFGFVDPRDVLRACHVIPCYTEGQRSPDRKSVSPLAQDGEDWKTYYVAKFADRDSLMRFEWGMGIGHTYWYSSFSQELRRTAQTSSAVTGGNFFGQRADTDIQSLLTLPLMRTVEEEGSDAECDQNGELKDMEDEMMGIDPGESSSEKDPESSDSEEFV